jgi:two-component system, OmpR family, phosphate regulon sensor histidine kinase PhoR
LRGSVTAVAIVLIAIFFINGVIPLIPSLLLSGVLLAGLLLEARKASAHSVSSAFSEKQSPAELSLRDVFDRLADPVILVDEERKVMLASRTALDTFNAGMEGRDLVLSLRHPEVLEATDAALSGHGDQTKEIILPGAASRNFKLQINALSNGGRSAALLVFHDMTGAVMAERMRADFVANVSHELRSPLSALIGFIETLKGAARDDPEARQRFLTIMTKESHRMARLIDDLLSLSRIEINEHVPPQDKVDIGLLLGEVVLSMDLRAKEKGMLLDLDVLSSPALVVGDKDELIQVFQNLIDNAIKYGRPKNRIGITLGKAHPIPGTRETGFSIAVQDQGDGIAHDQIPRLTERFYRTDKVRSRSLGGTGLGLAIAKHIVNRHQGQLAIKSTLGEGSTFTVYLPNA